MPHSMRVWSGLLTHACLLACLQISLAYADPMPKGPVAELGDVAKLTGWTGLQQSKDGARLAVPGEAKFQYESETDWRDWYAIRFDVQLTDDRPVTLEFSIVPKPADRYPASISSKVALVGAGWHTVSVPWNAFPLPQQAGTMFGNISELGLRASADDGKPASVILRDARLVRAETVKIDAPRSGQSVDPGKTAEYPVTLSNCTDKPQALTLTFERNGFQAMTPTVEPQALTLPPRGSAQVMVRVHVPERIPAGGHETQTLIASANGVVAPTAKLAFVTASRMAHPYITHTRQEWDEVRDKVKKYEWARALQDQYVADATKWKVPEVANKVNPKKGDWLFPTQVENGVVASGIAYQLTGDVQYAQKLRQFMLNLSNPQNGYPVTLRGCHQASVQEGHFFQNIIRAYDMVLPSGIFTEADIQQINHTLRLFIGPLVMHDGQISNWNVSYLCGQLNASLLLQDLAAANHFLYDQGGIIDQIAQGTLDDGWWYECSISYNVWCATEFSQVAIAMRPWGVDLLNTAFSNAYRPNDETLPEKQIYGMSKARWGPIVHNTMTIKRMWDALPPVVDYRGMIFGLNDSSAKPIVGQQMDIAYYLFRDPAYVALIKRGGGKRDLLYGVPELPDNTADFSTKSAYADNSGVAVLRSQTADRPQRERIQAALHYGDHGWFHGHFDRTDLLHLSRFGRSFFHPEFIWYGYGNYLYKFYVQTSVSKNMVVVDQKMQEPVESQRLLFHSGPMMQATVVQTNARWSNPPYGGMVYGDNEPTTFAEKALKEGRSIPIPASAPKYGEVTDYTEPVLQRRLLVVADDYIVLADYMKGQKEHTFDNLLQLKTFQGLEGADGSPLKPVKHTGQWTPNPLSSAQFVTNCDWYQALAPVRGSYEFRWGPDADNAGTITDINDDGVLKIDTYNLWPQQQQIMIGMPPESHNVNKLVDYVIRGDGKTLLEGKTGAWILGEVNVDVPVAGVKELALDALTGGSQLSTLFWANARIITADGAEIPLSKLPLKSDNTRQPKDAGLDYAGGPITIAGITYTQAVPAESQDHKKPSHVTVDLSGINAARFKCVFGCDYPVGNEAQRHKTVAARAVGKEARFLTVIEPFESKRMVKSATALSADKLRVELTDGRVQEIEIKNMEGSGSDIAVTMTEQTAGKPTRTESTHDAHR